MAVRAGQGCDARFAGAIPETAIQDQLRAAGFRLAKAHSATLADEIECVPVQTAQTAIHQCVALSEVVATGAGSHGLALATTWRQCRSYTCNRNSCDTQVQSGSRSLVDAFISDFRDRPEPASPQPAQTAQRPAVFAAIGPFMPRITLFIYLGYIVSCIALLFRWEWCKHVR